MGCRGMDVWGGGGRGGAAIMLCGDTKDRSIILLQLARDRSRGGGCGGERMYVYICACVWVCVYGSECM